MNYKSPELYTIDDETLKELITVYASSDPHAGCGFIGCPEPYFFQSGGGCGYAYDNGSCTGYSS